jgi:hypothetical protein
VKSNAILMGHKPTGVDLTLELVEIAGAGEICVGKVFDCVVTAGLAGKCSTNERKGALAEL